MTKKETIVSIMRNNAKEMYVFSVLALLLCFLVKYLTHEAANETMIAVLNTAIGGVTGMLGMAVASIFNASKPRDQGQRAADGATPGSGVPSAPSTGTNGGPDVGGTATAGATS